MASGSIHEQGGQGGRGEEVSSDCFRVIVFQFITSNCVHKGLVIRTSKVTEAPT
jgi:hypothetical protein